MRVPNHKDNEKCNGNEVGGRGGPSSVLDCLKQISSTKKTQKTFTKTVEQS